MARWSTRLLGGLLPFIVGCGGAAATAPSNQAAVATSDPSAQPEPGAAPGAAGAPTAAPTTADGSPKAQPAVEPVLAAESAPGGLKPLSEAEQQQLKGDCAKLVTWAQKRAGKAATRAAATQGLLEVLGQAPQIEGVDVAGCSALLTRELQVYIARTKETEATTTLKMLMLAMATAVERKGELCPSAPPVPKELSAVKTAPYQPRAGDWKAAGWSCLGHANPQPQRFQYEVQSDPAGGSFQVVARGYPVPGAEATELSLRCKLVDGKVEMHSNIYRR